MSLFEQFWLAGAMEELVLGEKMPVLGVCVGMQMMAGRSDEGRLPGLGWIPGQVRSLLPIPESGRLPMPHMGWNDLEVGRSKRLSSLGLEETPEILFPAFILLRLSGPIHVGGTADYGVRVSPAWSLPETSMACSAIPRKAITLARSC